MAKIISYQFAVGENSQGEQILQDKAIDWSEANEEIAKKEAYNGKYTTEDDGQPEPQAPPTDAERIAELEEALDMLLSGVTE